METYNLVSFLGIFLLLGFAWLCSSNKKIMNWRVIFWGTLLQILFAAFIFLVPAGSKLLLIINDVVIKVLSSARAGTEFVFGRLACRPVPRMRPVNPLSVLSLPFRDSPPSSSSPASWASSIF